MDLNPGLIWISTATQKDPQESRILDLLSDLVPYVVRGSSNSPDSLCFPRAEGVILNLAEGDPALDSYLERIQSQAPGAKILIRCATLLANSNWRDQGNALDFLDEREGPELARIRIVKWLANGQVRERQREEVRPAWRKTLIGESRPIQKVAEVIRLVGPRRCSVLIQGETGVGKEIAARAIHQAGPRASKPFVAINCGAIPSALLEAELFGHTRGAFTGAAQVRIGRFEQASGGTLFLDEIGDIPLELQAKLLRVLQEREIQKLGSGETIKVDARIVAATNCDLRVKIREGSFREDLYYRLNVVPLELPPLRARVSDIRLLAEHFLANICQEERIAPKRLTPQAWSALEGYDWPGNVRQLENAISAAVILGESRIYLDEDDFALQSNSVRFGGEEMKGFELPQYGLDFEKTVNALERNLLEQALRKTNGNKKAAADMLRLKRTTLSAKVRVLEVDQSLYAAQDFARGRLT